MIQVLRFAMDCHPDPVRMYVNLTPPMQCGAADMKSAAPQGL